MLSEPTATPFRPSPLPAASLPGKRCRGLLATLLAALSLPTLAQGQTSSPPRATLPAVTVSDRAIAESLEQPVAAGSRLDLSPLETPASVDVVTRDQLESRGDANVIQAITRSTGITTMGHPGNTGSALSARGFNDSTSVMMLYDGVRQYGNVSPSFPYSTWAVERIEILRGPASVIHGDGAIGAVVNLVPKKPTRGPIQHEVEVTVGNQGRRGLAFGSGGAIDDRLSYRLDLNGDRADGWVDRGRHSDRGLSGALRFDATPDLNLTVSHARGRQKPMSYYGLPLIDGRALEALRERNYDVRNGRIDYKDQWTELKAEWSPTAALTVRSRLYHIRSDRYWRNVETFDHDPATGLIDRSGATEIAHRQRQTGNTTDLVWRHELFGLANQVSVGFDINQSRFRHSNNTYTGSVSPVDPFDFEPGEYASEIPFLPRYQNRARQRAWFAEDRLVLSERWSLVGGLRRDQLQLDRTDLVVGGQAFDRRFTNTGWRLGAVYQLQPTRSLYAQIARAADPVSSLFFLTPANSVFDMSHGRQVEVGLKQVLPERRGEFTVSAYQIVKNNLLTRDATNPSLRVQVGERSSRGIEGALSLAVTPTVRLEANAALLRARYDDFSEPVGGSLVSRKGKVPTDVPERVANLWLDWEASPGWILGGGARHVGKRYADNANTLVLPSYTTVDLALRWKLTTQTTMALRGFNVFDRFFFTTAYYGGTQWLVGEGRRVELSLLHRF